MILVAQIQIDQKEFLRGQHIFAHMSPMLEGRQRIFPTEIFVIRSIDFHIPYSLLQAAGICSFGEISAVWLYFLVFTSSLKVMRSNETNQDRILQYLSNRR